MVNSEMPNEQAPFTFRAAQVFVAVVEAGSVTRAAHRLGMSPSSVSQQLTGLEAALGARLLERSARQFRLTRAGELFLDPARQLLDDVGAAKARLLMADETPPIALRIASVEELDAAVSTRWLLNLTRRFPNLSLSLTSGASHENHSALESRSVDMMLAVDTVASVDWVEMHPILRDPFILVTSPELNDLPLDSLTAKPFVRYSSDLLIGRQIDAQMRRLGVSSNPVFEFTTNQALFAMTSEIKGWTITTALSFLGTPFERDSLTAHPLPFARFSRRMALHARSGALAGLPTVFADELRDCIEARIFPEIDTVLPSLKGDMQILR